MPGELGLPELLVLVLVALVVVAPQRLPVVSALLGRFDTRTRTADEPTGPEDLVDAALLTTAVLLVLLLAGMIAQRFIQA